MPVVYSDDIDENKLFFIAPFLNCGLEVLTTSATCTLSHSDKLKTMLYLQLVGDLD